MSTFTVSVEVEDEDIREAGWHTDDECDMDGYHSDQECEAARLRAALEAMHNEHHPGPYWLCRVDPCRSVNP